MSQNAGPAHHITSAPEKHGLTIISADYRLAPQARLPAIMKDCSAVMAYIRSEEFDRATGGKVDQSKICVSGGSAGGLYTVSLDCHKRADCEMCCLGQVDGSPCSSGWESGSKPAVWRHLQHLPQLLLCTPFQIYMIPSGIPSNTLSPTSRV